MKCFKTYALALLSLTLFGSMLYPCRVNAQKTNPPRTSDMTDEQWNAWQVGVITNEEANVCYQRQEYRKAIALYEKSLSLFRSLQKSKPYWQKQRIKKRVEIIEQRIAQSKANLEIQEREVKKSTADKNLEAKIATENAAATAEIAELKLQLETVQKQNVNFREQLEKAKEIVKQVQTLLQEKSEMEKKYSLLLLQYNNLLEKGKNERSEAEVALQKAYEGAKKSIADMEATLRNEEKISNGLQAENDKLKNDLANAQKLVAEAERKNAAAQKLEDRILKLQEELTKAELAKGKALQGKDAEIVQLRKELSQKTRELEETSDALSKARDNMKLDVAMRQIEQEAATFKAENERLQRQMAALLAEKDKLAQKLADQAETVKRTGEMSKNLTERNKRLEQDLQSCKSEVQKMSSELKLLSEQHKKVSAELEKVKRERDTISEQMRNRSIEQSAEDKAKLEEQKEATAAANRKNEGLRVAFDRCKEQMNELNAQKTELTQRLQKQNERIQELEKEQVENRKKLEYLEKIKKEYDMQVRLAEQLRAVQMENNVLKAENEKLKKQDISAELQKELDRVKGEINKQNNEYGRMRDHLKSLQGKLLEQQATYASLNKQYEAAVAENKALKGDVKTLKEYRERLLTEEQQRKLQNDLTEKEKRIEELEKIIGELHGKNTQCLRDMERGREQVEKVTQQLNDTMAQVQSLQKKLTETEASFLQEKKNADIAQQQTVLNLKTENEALRKQIALLQGELAKQKAAVPAPAQASADATNTKEMLGKIGKLQKERDDLVKERDALESQSKKLQEEITNYKKTSDAREDNIEDLKKKNQELSRALQTAMNNLQKQRDECEKEKAVLEQKLAMEQKKEKFLQSELDQWKAGAQEKIRGELREKEKIVEQVLQGNKLLTENVARLQNEIGLLNAEIASCRREMERLDNAKKDLEQRLRLVPEAQRNTPGENVTPPRATQSGARGTDTTVIKESPKDGMVAEKPAATPSTASLVKKEATPEMKKKCTELMNEAQAAWKENDLDTAIWKYLQAADANPFTPEPHQCLVSIYIQKKNGKSAEKEYRKALSKGAARDEKTERTLKSLQEGK